MRSLTVSYLSLFQFRRKYFCPFSIEGFDDQGSQYDSAGNLRNWWQNATRDAYLKKAECIINQYGNYTEPLTKLKLNGINTQGENIADNGEMRSMIKDAIV